MEKNITPDTVICALAGHTSSAVSDFPIDVFPAKLQRIVLELHTSCGFPIDYTASAMLAAISVAIGNTHRVEVKRNWRESAIIYMAIVGRPEQTNLIRSISQCAHWSMLTGRIIKSTRNSFARIRKPSP